MLRGKRPSEAQGPAATWTAPEPEVRTDQPLVRRMIRSSITGLRTGSQSVVYPLRIVGTDEHTTRWPGGGAGLGDCATPPIWLVLQAPRAGDARARTKAVLI